MSNNAHDLMVKFENARKYWSEKLTGALPDSLYTDYPRTGAGEKAEAIFPLPQDIAHTLWRISKNVDLSLYIALAAIFKIFCLKYADQTDTIIVSPLYSATDAQANSYIVIRDNLNETMTFREVLFQVKQSVITGYQNQYYPIPKLAESLGLPRHLYRIILMLENIHSRESVAHLIQDPENDLTFSFRRQEESLHLNISYNQRLYKPATIEQIARSYFYLMEQTIADPARPLVDFQLLSPLEQEKIMNFNPEPRNITNRQTFVELFEEQAAQTPNRVALQYIFSLDALHQELMNNYHHDSSIAQIMKCCFKTNPYLIQARLNLTPPSEKDGNPNTDQEFRLFKTQAGNNVIASLNINKFLPLFDGKKTFGSLYTLLRSLDEPVLFCPVSHDDPLEIYQKIGAMSCFSPGNPFELIGLVKALYQNKLVQLTGYLSESITPEAPLAEAPREGTRDLIRAAIPLEQIFRPKASLETAEVLLLGDTPGMASTGLLYLASYLYRNGVPAYCQFFDPNLDQQALQKNIEELLNAVRPKFVGLSMKWFPHMARVIAMCKLIKSCRPEIKTIIGGNTASFYYQELIQNEAIDYIVKGDGEVPLLSICRGAGSLPNCVYKSQGKIIDNPISYLHDETNAPEIYLSDLERILLSPNASLFGSFFIYTHKGCMMNCVYCGGCHEAHRKAFNRQRFFRRGVTEVRKDIEEALPYTSTFMFDFDAPNDQLLEYCRKIWEGIDLSRHFCIFLNLIPPSAPLIELVNTTFKYIYWDLDMCSLSERHRNQMFDLKIVKPQPADSEVFAFLAECEKYLNNEVRISIIAGLPCFTKEDIEISEKTLTWILNQYRCFSELHWARFHAQPGAPIIGTASRYQMYSCATSFKDFLDYSELNMNQPVYPGLETINYPYVYFEDNRLNSEITQHYFKATQQFQANRRKRQYPVIFSKQLTYRELDQQANRLANYLQHEQQIGPNTLVGILMDHCPEQMIALLGIIKAGGAYVPISPELPQERIKTMIIDANIRLMISVKKYVKLLNHLQWECPKFDTYLCMDGEEIAFESETESNQLMDPSLWEYIGESAVNEIQGGGWVNRYTGADLSAAEMKEYADNVFEKVKPFIDPATRILEIGCASGISMFRIAPAAGYYFGTDLSKVIIRKDQDRVARDKITNISLAALPAHEVDRVPENDFDMVIMNSVIQAFHGHNYLRQVIRKAIRKMKDTGVIFIGDVMDQDLKADLERSIREYKRQHPQSKTVIDLTTELFISRDFFEDLAQDIPEIKAVRFSTKLHTIENELTRFRYDAIMEIDKAGKKGAVGKRHKYQLGAGVLDRCDSTPLPGKPVPKDLLYVIYTSGTTGQPRGVMVEHHSLLNYTAWRISNYRLHPADTTLQLVSFSFDGAASNLYSSLGSGGKLIILDDQERLNLGLVRDVIHENRVTNLSIVPAMYRALIENAEGADFSSLRFVVLAGEKADPNLVESSAMNHPDILLINEYGPTENTVTTSALIGMTPETAAVIGQPITNHQVYVLNQHRTLKPMGVPGELCVSGAGLARGYLNQPELTGEKFVVGVIHESPLPRMYRTGDLARWLDDGNLELLGRIDNQVKIRGFRIELAEIELQIAGYDQVKEALVIAKEDPQGDKYLCAYLVAGGELNLTDLREYLAAKLPDYLIPSHFVQLAKMPLNANGKVDRKRLPEPSMENQRDTEYMAPHNQYEERLMTIWQEILGVEKISIDNNFFELGGHSLKATTMVSRIHKEFNVEIPLREVFKTPTVIDLAKLIAESAGNLYTEIKPAPPRNYYPLSAAQRRLFILNQLEGIATSYNMPGALLIEGTPDRNQIQETLRALVQRHEAFRTSFIMVNEEPVQQIQPSVEFALEGEDSFEGEDSNPRLDLIIRDFIRPFDLREAPLFRARLLKIEAEKYVLLFDMHHIISDGSSMEILIREFIRLFQGVPLPELKIQYKDYAVWQNEAFHWEIMKKQEEYWLQTLSGQLPVLELPLDYPRPAVMSFAGDTAGFTIDESFAAKLNTLALSQGTTLFMVMLAAYNLLLSRLTGQTDLLVGSPVSGRKHHDLENIVGIFLNTVVFRNQPLPDKNFTAFLKEVTENSLRAFENQDYQFEMLLEKLALPRDLRRTPLFDVMFNFLKPGRFEDASFEKLRFSQYPFANPAAKFDLNLYAVELEKGISVYCYYRTDLFRKTTLDYILGEYFKLLKAIAVSPDESLASYRIFRREDLTLSRLWSDSSVIAPGPYQEFGPEAIEQSIVKRFEEQVKTHGAQIAIKTSARALSYQELNRVANRVARRVAGQEDGQMVALLFEHDAGMVIGMLGVLKAGKTYIPFDPEYPLERLRFMMADSQTGLILTNDRNLALAKRLSATQPVTIVNIDEIGADLPETNLDIEIPSGQIAYILYTSGSTGNPKGVIQNHRNVLHFIRCYTNNLRLNSRDKLTLFSSYSFDAAVMDIYGALLNGATLCPYSLKAETQAVSLRQWLNAEAITVFHSIPNVYRYFIGSLNPEDRFDQIRLVVMGGEEVVKSDVEAYRRHFSKQCIFVNGLGPTESTVTLQYFIDHQTEITGHSVPVGYPVAETEVYILNDRGREAGVYEIGQLVYKSEYLAPGYCNLPEKTSQVFLRDPLTQTGTVYQTGDLGRLLPDGTIIFMGRNDFQVKIRGYRIELTEIEVALDSIPGIGKSVVNSYHTAQGESFLAAYYTVSSTGTLKPNQLRKELGKRLPDFMIPAYLIELERLPLTASGKIDRRGLPKPDAELPVKTHYVAPRSKLEAQLAGIWQAILGLEQVGVTDGFFELGGHSLKAMQMIARLHHELNIELPLSEVFRRPTINELASAIEEWRTDIYSDIIPVEEKPYYALSSAQKRLYILNESEGDNINYNISGAMFISGALDSAHIEAVFGQLIGRHEILRTSFELVDGEPVQKIHPEVDFKLNLLELEMDRLQMEQESSLDLLWDDPRFQQPIDELIARFIRPFDLTLAPLMRIGLARLAPHLFILIYDMHHIISDGTSLTILAKEFIHLYNGEALPPLRIQYKDYSAWQGQSGAWQGQAEARQNQAGAGQGQSGISQNDLAVFNRWEKQEKYWLQQFSGVIPVLNLPTDFPRPPIRSFEGDRITFILNQELTSGLKQLGLETGATLFMLLLAVYNILLAKYTGQEDIVIGAPVAGRSRAELENMMGMFVNTLALRNFPSGTKTFREFLNEVKTNALQAFENQDFQFEMLIEKLKLDWEPNRNPLFDTMFALQNMDFSNSGMGQTNFRPYPIKKKITKFDLGLDAVEAGGVIDFSLQYATRLFTGESMAVLIRSLSIIAAAIVNNPDIPIGEIRLYDEAEKSRLIDEYNRTRRRNPVDPNSGEGKTDQKQKIKADFNF